MEAVSTLAKCKMSGSLYVVVFLSSLYDNLHMYTEKFCISILTQIGP